jgi:hypothetical protein
MVVVGVIGQVFECARTIFLQGLARKPGSGDQPDRPENRRLSYARVGLLRFAQNVVDSEVPFGSQKCLENDSAWPGHFWHGREGNLQTSPARSFKGPLAAGKRYDETISMP